MLRTFSCYGIFAELSVHWILLIFGSTFVSNKEIIALECEKIDIFAVFPLLKMLRIICRKPLRIYNLPTQKQIIFGFLSFFKKEEEGFDFGERRESSASRTEILEKDSVSIEEWVDVWGETVRRLHP